MLKVFIVCANIKNVCIPEPMGKMTHGMLMPPNVGEIPPTTLRDFTLGIPPSGGLYPRFDPISPTFIPAPTKQSKPDNILYVCKDLDTAKQFSSTISGSYILGPYNII